MHTVDLIVGLVLASALLAGLARLIRVHYAIVLVLAGLAFGLIPGVPHPVVKPDLVLFVFLPPLVYAAAFGISTQDLREHARPIGVLSVGLVLATMCGVAAVAHFVAGFAWGPAMVLGAILAPTDPIAATSVLRRLGAPDRTSTILEGEALINDGTGLTVYTIAVSAVVSGHFSPAAGVLRFVGVAAGGVAIGLVAGWLSGEVRRRIDEPPIEIAISLLTAYLAYVPAQQLGLSGVLAAVAAGLYSSRQAGVVLSASSRLQTIGFWEALTFLLESVLFLLIGLEFGHIADGLHRDVGTPLLDAAAVVAGAMAIRMAWMFVVPTVARVAALRSGSEPGQTPGELLVLGWSGMRGGVSLAAALAIPLTAQGHPFSDRATLLFVSYIAIAATLVIPGLTLAPLVRRLGLGEEEAVIRAERRARVTMAQAALAHLDDVAERDGADERVLEQFRTAYELRLHRLAPQAQDGEEGPTLAARANDLRRELIDIERARLSELRRQGALSLPSQRRIERELDLEESRLGG